MAIARANTVVQDEDYHEYSETEPGTVCIRPEHLEAGHDCATPDTFDLLQGVTHLLRQAEVLEAQARNHWRVNTRVPVKYRGAWIRTATARQALAEAERLLDVLWKEEQ